MILKGLTLREQKHQKKDTCTLRREILCHHKCGKSKEKKVGRNLVTKKGSGAVNRAETKGSGLHFVWRKNANFLVFDIS